MTKEDLEQIAELLEPLKQGQAQAIERLSKLEEGQGSLQADVAQIKTEVGHLKTAVEAVKAGVDDVRDRMATESTVMDQNAKLDRITRNHERRIEELEAHAGLKNPYKN